GLHNPRNYVWFVRIVFCLIGLGTSLGVFALIRDLGGRLLAAAAGAAIFALAVPSVFFAPRAMGETTSALLVIWGFALTLPCSSRRASIVGASLLGLATMLRLQSALFSLTLVLILLIQRRWRTSGQVTLVLTVWFGALGLLDLLTWGSWFH